MLEAEVDELKVRHRIDKLTDPVQASMTLDQVRARQDELDRESERASQLVVKSASDGVFVLRRPGDLPGRKAQRLRRPGNVTFLTDQLFLETLTFQ